MTAFLSEEEAESGTWLGRIWRADVEGPSVVTLRKGRVYDLT